MRIMITGNLGYVGACVSDALDEFPKVETVIGFDSGWFKDCATGKVTGEPSKLVQMFGDVRDITKDTFDGIDAVIHLAAVSNDPIGTRFSQPTEVINGSATAHVAYCAKSAGVKKFVFASSCSLYGAAGNSERKEDDDLEPLTAYARGKAAAEKELQAINSKTFGAVSLRFATACGWSRRFRSDLVLNDFVLTALLTGEVRVLSDGTPWRPLIHVSDMARTLLWAAIEYDGGDGGWSVFNVGRTDMNVRVGELAHEVARMLPGTQVSINRDAEPDKRSYSVDFSRLSKVAPAEVLPKINLNAAIDDLSSELAVFLNGRTIQDTPETVRLRVLENHVRSGRLDEELRWVP